MVHGEKISGFLDLVFSFSNIWKTEDKGKHSSILYFTNLMSERFGFKRKISHQGRREDGISLPH